MTASHRSILAYLKELAETQPRKKLLGSHEHWLTAAEVFSFVERIGTAFRRLGLSGGRVAFHCTRSPEASLMLLGLRAAGVTAVLVDPRQPVEQALTQAEGAITVGAVIDPVDSCTFSITPADAAEAISLKLDALPPSDGQTVEAADDPAFIIFTSGSTGKSKAVVLCESNLVNNLLDSEPLGAYRKDDIALGALPMNHVFGLVLLSGIAVLGYSLFFPEKTDVASLLAAIEQEKLTRMNGVPSLYLAMAAQSESYDLSSLHAGFIGGGPVTEAQFALIEEKLQITLVPVYGMSECIGVACASHLAPQAERMGCVGAFYSMNTGRILLEDGSEAAPMQPGEVCVTGPARMIGYYDHPMPREELFHTGDIGYVDEKGLLHLTGRKKNIIIRNGNNLSPRRIEEALLALPGIRDAVVVGLPDDLQGEIPAAWVVADPGLGTPQPDLPRNELPAFYHFAESLPMTYSGKPDRQKIRQILEEARR